VARTLIPGALIAQGQRQGLSPTPIFIIDGVRVDQAAFTRLRRDDIEGVEVLKGKAAAALYGADAEGGVITVKTKRE
jgi:TonB-dependent SusC/RagA subfamily outer membrane receptor